MPENNPGMYLEKFVTSLMTHNTLKMVIAPETADSFT